MRIAKTPLRRLMLLAAGLCLAALPVRAQLNGYYHPASFTEGNLFLYGPAEGDGFAHALAAGDFNGDGADDLATGIPYDENAGAMYPDSGIVIIRYGVPGTGLKGGLATQVVSQFNGGSPNPPEQDDWFGFSLAAADFNGDGYDDLAIGAPKDDDGGGGVQIHYGSAAGLSLGGAQFFSQDSPGISGSSEDTDFFGYALAAGNFDGDAYADLAIGMPGAGSKTRLIFSLVRATADGWFLNVSHWNDNIAGFQFSGGGFFACAASPCGNPADWHNNRIDFEWTRGNPGHLTMWRTRYVGGAPDASGKIQIFSVGLPGMQSAVVNDVFAGMFAGQDAGTYGALYLDEFSFNR